MNRAQSVFDEVRKAVIYDKLVRKLESASQKPQTTDMVKGKDDDSWSSLPVDSSLHHPVYSQKSATEKSHMQLRDVSESRLCDAEVQPAVFDQPSSGIRNSETRLFASDNGQRGHPADSEMIGQDLWKQLKRVTIPVFSGDKKTYQNWRAAFMACVDQAPATAEYKLLQLQQCLAGGSLDGYRKFRSFCNNISNCKGEIRSKVWRSNSIVSRRNR